MRRRGPESHKEDWKAVVFKLFAGREKSKNLTKRIERMLCCGNRGHQYRISQRELKDFFVDHCAFTFLLSNLTKRIERGHAFGGYWRGPRRNLTKRIESLVASQYLLSWWTSNLTKRIESILGWGIKNKKQESHKENWKTPSYSEKLQILRNLTKRIERKVHVAALWPPPKESHKENWKKSISSKVSHSNKNRISQRELKE